MKWCGSRDVWRVAAAVIVVTLVGGLEVAAQETELPTMPNVRIDPEGNFDPAYKGSLDDRNEQNLEAGEASGDTVIPFLVSEPPLGVPVESSAEEEAETGGI